MKSKILYFSHTIGLHTYKHNNGLSMMSHEIRDDFKKYHNITKLYDLNIQFLRPSWGHLSYFVLQYMKKHNFNLLLERGYEFETIDSKN